MARFGFRKEASDFTCIFFGAKPSSVLLLIAVFLFSVVTSRPTSSIADFKSKSSGILKITDDLPANEPINEPINEPKIEATLRSADQQVSIISNEKRWLIFDFLNVLTQLATDSSLDEEKMQGDQPADMQFRGDKSMGYNETEDKYARQREMAINEYKRRVLAFTGYDKIPMDPTNRPFSTTNRSLPPTNFANITIPIIPTMKAGYKKIAVAPICPHKNEKNLTVIFNTSEPKALSRNMILNVISAELKLFKIPVQIHESESASDDDTEMSKWTETFRKSNVNVSERIMKAKSEEDEMIQITIYKIRNKQRNSELKKLDTRMIPASFHGITTWNITKAINVWGNDTKRTLSLIITAEDDSGKILPTKNVFEMRCSNTFEKPSPLLTSDKLSENSHTAWIDLTTEEIAAKVAAYNGIASSVNQFSSEYYRSGLRRGEHRTQQTNQSKETSYSAED